jgi:hypothetical protein
VLEAYDNDPKDVGDTEGPREVDASMINASVVDGAGECLRGAETWLS